MTEARVPQFQKQGVRTLLSSFPKSWVSTHWMMKLYMLHFQLLFPYKKKYSNISEPKRQYGMVWYYGAGFPMHWNLIWSIVQSHWIFNSAAIPSQFQRNARPTCRRTGVSSYHPLLYLREIVLGQRHLSENSDT
jgi:hypothetical protein